MNVYDNVSVEELTFHWSIAFNHNKPREEHELLGFKPFIELIVMIENVHGLRFDVILSCYSWTLTSASWPSTWSRSHVYTSSCPASLHWRHVEASSTERWLFPNSHSRCLIPRTWWLPATLVMAATWPSPPSSEVACRWRRYVSELFLSY